MYDEHMIDWEAIKAEYEQGDSQRVLAARHNVPRTTIASRAKVEHWKHPQSFRPPPTMDEQPDEDDLFSLAQFALSKLAVHLKGDLELKDHKLFADALNQYSKVIAAAPPAPSSQSSYIAPELIAVMTPQEQDIVQKILSEAEQRLKQDEKITPLRRAQ